ncbi:MAG: UDP-N-acetylglucosamine 1-carboxyvinyltransferase [Ruminococcaceae bacterium]|nr:UDP-N-acetylglucosamine 1-carboxyvinyltransferase [Oscillospiraceae bacterium]
MDKLVIHGGNPLMGEVCISGAKNAAVAVLPATLLVDGTCRLENIPKIKDVLLICDILRSLGAKVTLEDDGAVEIDALALTYKSAPYELVGKMRASYYLIGAMLGRFNKAEVAMPGGCDLGPRPIDQHQKGFEALGAKTVVENGVIYAETEKLVGGNVYLDIVSVGATMNIMLAAVLAQGNTVIENAAKEPHIVDLANFLNAMGANIKGAGTDIIKIKGVSKLHGGVYSIIPDQIEAGTFMVAAAATRGDVLIKNVIPKHLESISSKLIEMGVTVEEFDDSVRVSCGKDKKLNPISVKTLPYPGFPTDMQPQMSVLLSVTKGTSMVSENVWDSRFQYVDELKRMGADIKVEGRVAVIEGVDTLSGAPVRSTDLRAGAGMVIAALIAKGTTEIYALHHIDRGYENMEGKFRALGADIERVSE